MTRDGMSGTKERRAIELRDQFGECKICVWGDYVHMFDHDPIGRSVTLCGITLTMYANTMHICWTKDSSIVVGSDADVATASLQRFQL